MGKYASGLPPSLSMMTEGYRYKNDERRKIMADCKKSI